MILAVGQFIQRKGFDILMRAAVTLNDEVGIYIVGGEPPEEYIKFKNRYCLNNVYFAGFKTKTELSEYYRAADLFVHPTREDIWGLVINEAMAYSLPVITTDKCVAGVELVETGSNGYIVPGEDVFGLNKAIVNALNNKYIKDIEALNMAKMDQYTVNRMADQHMNIFQRLNEIYEEK